MSNDYLQIAGDHTMIELDVQGLPMDIHRWFSLVLRLQVALDAIARWCLDIVHMDRKGE